MRGGGITAAFEGLGVVAMIAAQLMKSSWYDSDESFLDTYLAYPFFIGLGSYLGGAIYGIIRAQTYHKPGSQIANSPFERLQLNLVSHDSKNIGLEATYRWRF